MYTYVCIVWCRGTRRTRCERKLQMAQCICTWFRCHVSNVALRVTPNLAHVLGVVFCALSCEPFISCDMFVDPLSNSIWTSYELYIDVYTHVTGFIGSANYMEYMYFCMLFLVVLSGFMHHPSCRCNIDKPYICIFFCFLYTVYRWVTPNPTYVLGVLLHALSRGIIILCDTSMVPCLNR